MKGSRLEHIDEDRIYRIGLHLHGKKGTLCACGKDNCPCCQRQFLYDMTDRLLRLRKRTPLPTAPSPRTQG